MNGACEQRFGPRGNQFPANLEKVQRFKTQAGIFTSPCLTRIRYFMQTKVHILQGA